MIRPLMSPKRLRRSRRLGQNNACRFCAFWCGRVLKGLSIGELGERSGVTGSTLTHHMKLLAAAGLVRQVRDGRRIICIGAAYERMQALSNFLLKECCADASDGGHDHG